MASGKSTLARQVAKDKASVLICEDALLAELYPGEITDVSSYARLSVRLKSAMRPIVIELLRNGVSVVLDFPANTIRQRRWLKEVVTEAGARYEFHFLDVPDAVCKSRLKLRVKSDPSRQSTDTEQMFDAMNQYFEAPSNEEGLNVAAGAKE